MYSHFFFQAESSHDYSSAQSRIDDSNYSSVKQKRSMRRPNDVIDSRENRNSTVYTFFALIFIRCLSIYTLMSAPSSWDRASVIFVVVEHSRYLSFHILCLCKPATAASFDYEHSFSNSQKSLSLRVVVDCGVVWPAPKKNIQLITINKERRITQANEYRLRTTFLAAFHPLNLNILW